VLFKKNPNGKWDRRNSVTWQEEEKSENEEKGKPTLNCTRCGKYFKR